MIKQLISGLINRIKEALGRFPETLALTTTFGLIAIYLNNNYGNSVIHESLEKVLMSLAIGILLTATLKLVSERWLPSSTYRLGGVVLSAGVMIGFYFLIPDPMTSLFSWRFGVTLVSLAFAFSIVPFWKKDYFYSVGALKLISDGAIAILYSVVLYLGGAAILFALEELLGIPVDSDWYGNYGILVGSIFAPTYYLGSLVQSGDDMINFSYSRVFRVLIAYIVMPLLSIYTLILYLYFLRLPFIGGLPQGEVANLVMWYSVISLMTFFLAAPIKEENLFVQKFLKLMPMAMLVPIGMMFVAIGIRIGAYGITVKRYFVVALGLWILGNTLYRIYNQWLKKTVLDAALIFSAVAVMLLSLYGPWSAYPVSIANQNARFEATLEELGLLKGTEILPSDQLSEADKNRISQFIMYFDNQHNLSDIKILPSEFNPNKDMKAIFGFDYTGYYYFRENKRYFNSYSEAQNTYTPLDGATALYQISWYGDNLGMSSKVKDIVGMEISPAGDIKLVLPESGLVTLPFGQWYFDHLKTLGYENQDQVTLKSHEAQFSKTLENHTYTFVVKGIGGYKNSDLSQVFERIEVLMLIK